MGAQSCEGHTRRPGAVVKAHTARPRRNSSRVETWAEALAALGGVLRGMVGGSRGRFTAHKRLLRVHRGNVWFPGGYSGYVWHGIGDVRSKGAARGTWQRQRRGRNVC